MKIILNWKTQKTQGTGLKPVKLRKLGELGWTVYCLFEEFIFFRLKLEKENFGYKVKIQKINGKEQIKFGKAIIKSLPRGASKENPVGIGSQTLKLLFKLIPNFAISHPATGQKFFEVGYDWTFAPRFENIQQGIFKNVYKIDIKSCYANIMRDYPLPYGYPQEITNPSEIEQKLKENKNGFLSFKLKLSAEIKNGQIPFLPNSRNEFKNKIKGGFFLYTKLFKTFCKQYKIKGKIYFNKLWIFKEKKGSLDKYLNYCEKLKKTDKQKGKILINALYGVFGRKNFSGYHYHPIHLAINHLAILKTYYLYRQFKPEQVLAIRSDCVYVKGELPLSILKQAKLYHIKEISETELKN